MSYSIQIERIEDIRDEIEPIHRAHWEETEMYRHGVGFAPDYRRLMDYERRGSYYLFTLRHEGKLVGNIGIYLNRSMHTQKKVASEDTFFILPEHRGGGTAKKFHDYVERQLQQAGVTEMRITVKNTNRVGKLMQRWGYEPVATEMVKVY